MVPATKLVLKTVKLHLLIPLVVVNPSITQFSVAYYRVKQLF